MAVLTVSSVTKHYGDLAALSGVDLNVEHGEIAGLVGRNGAGKTTLIAIIAGLRKPDGGSVRVDGVELDSAHRQKWASIGLATQELSLYMYATVRENLEFFAAIRGCGRREMVDDMDSVVSSLGLRDMLDRQVSRLSGGERRRVHIASALVPRPGLALLDEPTAGVDVETRRALLDLVQDLAARGTAICYSTHYLSEIEDLGATVNLLDRGRVLVSGSVSELIDQHARPALEISFSGDGIPEIPPLPVEQVLTNAPNTLRILTECPGQTAAHVLSALGANVERVSGIQVRRPSLEEVYLKLTGQRYLEADEESA